MVLRSVVAGVAAYLPERIVANAELAERINTSDEWIVQRTGIHERRIAADGEMTSDLAVAASRQALDRSGIRRRQTEPSRLQPPGFRVL